MNGPQRKPAHLERVGGQTPRQRIWAAIRKMKSGISNYGLAREAKADDETVRCYLAALTKAGFVERENQDRKRWEASTFRMVRDNGVEAPRVDRQGRPVTQGLATEQMWRTMRLMGDFNLHELSAQASTGQIKIGHETAKSYVKHLLRAGYLLTVQDADRRGPRLGNLPARYRLDLAKYTGPRPPMIQRSKSVYDPNLDRVVWEEVKRDDDF